jgi:hypothetical protein
MQPPQDQDRPPGKQPPEHSPAAAHPLATMIADAAAGRFPPADGGWRRVPPWRPGLEGIIAFTGHAVLALAPDITDERLAGLGVDGFGGAHDPRVVAAIAGAAAWIDSLDVLLAARGTGAAAAARPEPGRTAARPGPGRSAARPERGRSAARPEPGRSAARLADCGPDPAPGGSRLTARPDLAAHHRAQFAARIRGRRLVLGYPDRRRSAVVVVSSGLAGLTELSFELEPARRGTGAGAALVSDALSALPAGQLVVAAVAPGNAASLRAALAAGFRPLGSMQLFRRAGG